MFLCRRSSSSAGESRVCVLLRRSSSIPSRQKLDEQRLADYGAEILHLTAEELDAYARYVRAAAWPEVLKDIGEEWGQNALDSIQQ